jgi:hypothetical protein
MKGKLQHPQLASASHWPRATQHTVPLGAFAILVQGTPSWLFTRAKAPHPIGSSGCSAEGKQRLLTEWVE